jgi:hypothetical protein
VHLDATLDDFAVFAVLGVAVFAVFAAFAVLGVTTRVDVRGASALAPASAAPARAPFDGARDAAFPMLAMDGAKLAHPVVAHRPTIERFRRFSTRALTRSARAQRRRGARGAL